MISLLLLHGCLVGAIGVDITPVAGENLRCELVALEADSLVVKTGDETRRLPMSGVSTVVVLSPKAHAETVAPLASLLLWDQTKLPGELAGLSEGQLSFTFAGHTYGISQNLVHAVRFRPPGMPEATDATWEGILKSDPDKDRLVVRTNSSLDTIEGVAGDISSERVTFGADDETLRVKRTKVEGIVFAKPREMKVLPTVCELRVGGNARVAVAKVVAEADQLVVTTPSGAVLQLPVRHPWVFDFSGANTCWLSDLDPTHASQTSSVEVSLPSLKTALLPRRNQNRQGQSLALGGKVYSHGWSLVSQSELEFRLPAGYRKFTALVGIDRAAKDGQGQAQVTILGDTQSLWTGKITFRDPPQKIDVDITGVKTLKVTVSDLDQREFGDWVNLCEAKLIK